VSSEDLGKVMVANLSFLTISTHSIQYITIVLDECTIRKTWAMSRSWTKYYLCQ